MSEQDRPQSEEFVPVQGASAGAPPAGNVPPLPPEPPGTPPQEFRKNPRYREAKPFGASGTQIISEVQLMDPVALEKFRAKQAVELERRQSSAQAESAEQTVAQHPQEESYAASQEAYAQDAYAQQEYAQQEYVQAEYIQQEHVQQEYAAQPEYAQQESTQAEYSQAAQPVYYEEPAAPEAVYQQPVSASVYVVDQEAEYSEQYFSEPTAEYQESSAAPQPEPQAQYAAPEQPEIQVQYAASEQPEVQEQYVAPEEVVLQEQYAAPQQSEVQEHVAEEMVPQADYIQPQEYAQEYQDEARLLPPPPTQAFEEDEPQEYIELQQVHSVPNPETALPLPDVPTPQPVVEETPPHFQPEPVQELPPPAPQAEPEYPVYAEDHAQTAEDFSESDSQPVELTAESRIWSVPPPPVPPEPDPVVAAEAPTIPTNMQTEAPPSGSHLPEAPPPGHRQAVPPLPPNHPEQTGPSAMEKAAQMAADAKARLEQTVAGARAHLGLTGENAAAAAAQSLREAAGEQQQAETVTSAVLRSQAEAARQEEARREEENDTIFEAPAASVETEPAREQNRAADSASGEAGKNDSGANDNDSDANGRARIRIPWDENAVQELATGEAQTIQNGRTLVSSSVGDEKDKRGNGKKNRDKDETNKGAKEKNGKGKSAKEKNGREKVFNGGAMTDSSSQNTEGSMYGGMNGGRIPPASGGNDGAWLWLPQGIEQRRSWRKRHPILFWGTMLLVAFLIFSAGRLTMTEFSVNGDAIAVINVEGVILDSSELIEWIEKIEKNDSVKGALVRINSPGGAVGPSQEIYAALKRLDGKKPVVASLGTLAASGGYYAALGAREIVAGPSTITGSIGIKMQVPNVESLMRTLGISERTLVSGAYKDAGSAWRQMTREEEEYFYGILDDMYEEFIGVVSHERKISMEFMGNIADGKAMTGRQALQLKLVDSLGDKQDALQRLKAICQINEKASVSLLEGPQPRKEYLRGILSSLLSMIQDQKALTVQPMYMY